MLDHDKGRLAELREMVTDALARERLRLHPNKRQIGPVRGGLDLLGYRVFPDRRRLRNNNLGFRLASPPAGRRDNGGVPGTAAFTDAAGVVCGCP